MPDDVNDAIPPQPAAELVGDRPPAAADTAISPPPQALPARVGVLWWLTLSIIAVDQLTKALVRGSVSLFESKPLIPGLVDLAHVRNEGVAFGLFNSLDLQNKWIFTTALAMAALAGITFYARHIKPTERLARIGLSMILGGALGNLIDRVTAGYVLDFVDVYWRDWHFWAFNVADACISIGAVLVFVDLLLVRSHASDPV